MKKKRLLYYCIIIKKRKEQDREIDKKEAEDIRKKAMESISQTKKRNVEEGQGDINRKKTKVC